MFGIHARTHANTAFSHLIGWKKYVAKESKNTHIHPDFKLIWEINQNCDL